MSVETLPKPVDEAPRAASVSVVIPCLNEALSIERCVHAAHDVLAEHGFEGEVIVVDNGSDDGSGAIAARAGAKVITQPHRGYGNAYRAGFAAARGDFILMADADLSYDFEDLPRFVDELERGGELVIGDRMGNIQPGAMPWLNRYVGNPALTSLLNLLFRTGVRDAHCGMRGVRRELVEELDLRSTGMEFASEMVVRAARQGAGIRQLPIVYRPRQGESKLSPFRDGARHLRLLLVHSPLRLFVLPGAGMIAAGGAAAAIVLTHVRLLGRPWEMHTLIAGATLVVLGVQVLALGLCVHAYGASTLDARDPWFERLRGRFRPEHGLALGAGIALLSLGSGATVAASWAGHDFGRLHDEVLTIVAATLGVVAGQVLVASMLVSVMAERRAR